MSLPDEMAQLHNRWFVRMLSRDRLIAALLSLVCLLLAGRLIQLHLTSGGDFERLATRQRIFREVVPARPGEIVDRHGHVFATSVCVRSLYVVPREIRDGWNVARKLVGALALDPDCLFEHIAAHSERQFLWIKRRVTDAEAERIRTLKLPSGTWGFRDEFLRHYPQGTIAAQVVGLRDIDGHGQGGIEQ